MCDVNCAVPRTRTQNKKPIRNKNCNSYRWRQLLAGCALAIALLPALALAEPQAPSPGPAAATESSAAAAPQATQAPAKSDLDFDLMADSPKSAGPTPEELRRSLELDGKVRLRRQMLTAHQVFGFVSLAALAATLVVGQLNWLDKYHSGDFTGRYEDAHLGLGIATTGVFSVTGALALFAPNPYPKAIRFDTALVHKVSMILATAGMVAQIVLGPVITARVGKLDQPNIALGHLVTGYATFAFMAAGTVAYFF